MFRIFKKKIENEAVIDLAKLKEIEERQKAIKEASVEKSDTSFLTALAASATTEKAITNLDEEKMERLSKKIDRFLNRLELLEHKIQRIENRIDIKY